MQVKILAITQPIDETWNQEDIIEHAARTCYRSQHKMKSNPNFVKSVCDRGHLSTTEHVSFVFEIVTTRAIANQLERHRLASYSQESSRYCDMLNQPVIEPDEIAQHPYCHTVWLATVRTIKKAYKIFTEHGIKKENARAILPLNLETRLIFSCNTRELLHIINVRTSPKAQKEIREIASKMLEIAKQYCPSVFCLPQTKKGK
jgi:thymidylate synthase (FAD)